MKLLKVINSIPKHTAYRTLGEAMAALHRLKKRVPTASLYTLYDMLPEISGIHSYALTYDSPDLTQSLKTLSLEVHLKQFDLLHTSTKKLTGRIPTRLRDITLRLSKIFNVDSYLLENDNHLHLYTKLPNNTWLIVREGTPYRTNIVPKFRPPDLVTLTTKNPKTLLKERGLL